jgi:hypothetical protein
MTTNRNATGIRTLTVAKFSPEEKQMRKLILTLAALACAGLAAPAAASDGVSDGSSSPQLITAGMLGKAQAIHEFSAAENKEGQKEKGRDQPQVLGRMSFDSPGSGQPRSS